MSKPIIKIHNAETGEVIEREMTDAEYKEWLVRTKVEQQQDKEAEERLFQRQALLDKLGITADEAKLLLG